ncbi:glycosyltransferase family 2 protein [Marivirga salinae]|uniref:Glycosyltransferase family 2 protein n=1 Tax=Marivirga salinarum TaxID=3059078 RepID=A0AA51NCV7_9BACT|nr:glycosyltransferase family 2 protein [Marivirga sp. BDSF4-3]WMN12788.1 glycosyltransferase family 2 protein [Marivirga sp. BDSF4-3]
MADSIAVVILNYNGRDYLDKFLPNVIQNSSPHEVIIVDNASTDDSVQYLNTNFPELKLIETPENLGYAGGYNYALKQIETDFYILLNSDVETTPNWINPVISLMQQNEKIAACQPKIKSYNKKELFEYAGAAGGFIDHLGYPFCRGRIFSHLEKDQGQYDNNIPVFWATGACLFVKAKIFHEFGGLDDQFFAHMEEIDFCWRAKNAGHEIYYCGESTVYHVGGGTLKAESPFKTYLNFRNNWLLLYKNLSKEEFKSISKRRKRLDILAAIQFVAKGQKANANAILKAHRDFKEMKKHYNHNPTQGLQHIEIFKESIIKSFFVKRKKTFTELKWK